jgi:hypothetical protein
MDRDEPQTSFEDGLKKVHDQTLRKFNQQPFRKSLTKNASQQPLGKG